MILESRTVAKSVEKQEEITELREEKEYFMQTLMHNLKTPVRSEMRTLQMLLKGKFGDLSQDQFQVLQEILNSSNQMMFMIDSIILKNKLEMSKITFSPNTINISFLINNSIESMRVLFENKHQNITISFLNEAEEIYADYSSLKIIFMQLLSNAIKFSGEYSPISIEVSENSNNLSISVSDRGIGIDEKRLNHLFDFDIKNYKRCNSVGSGIGLYLVKRMIESQGGDIKVTSKKGEGSTFTIILPKIIPSHL